MVFDGETWLSDSAADRQASVIGNVLVFVHVEMNYTLTIWIFLLRAYASMATLVGESSI